MLFSFLKKMFRGGPTPAETFSHSRLRAPEGTSRLDYEASCRRLQGYYLAEGEMPPLPGRRPGYGEEGAAPGLSFFRTRVGDGDDFSLLSLPRSFFNRSEILQAAFRNTDLTESFFCWNDFSDVDFTGALLVRCDLRASVFVRVCFASADLREADLRRSSFETCDFTGAAMDGARLTPVQGKSLTLSEAQRALIAWTEDEGPEPAGG